MPSLVERYRAAAKMMRKYKAASLEASELDEGADRITELEAELAKVTAERDKWRNDVRLMEEDDERDAEKMLQMLIAAGIDPNEDDLGYATSYKAVVDAAVEWANRSIEQGNHPDYILADAVAALANREDG